LRIGVRKKLSVKVLLAAAVAVAATNSAVGPAAAATAPVSHPRVLIHYDLGAGRQPEAIVAEPGGAVDIGLGPAAQVERLTPDGRRRVIAQLPRPSDGGVDTPVLGFSMTTGLVRTADGTLYIGYAAGHDDLTGIWRVRPGGRPVRIAALPATSFPNGMDLDERTGRLYFSDSTRSTIWSLSLHGGDLVPWLTGPELDLGPDNLGVNGLKIHNGAVWVTNSQHGALLRIPITRKGRPGRVETRVSGISGLDDFTFTGRGDTVISAVNIANKVVLIRPDGSYETVLTTADGLSGATSVAVHRDTVFVTNGAFIPVPPLPQDPNLLVATLRR
jgi:hypothetical protein